MAQPRCCLFVLGKDKHGKQAGRSVGAWLVGSMCSVYTSLSLVVCWGMDGCMAMAMACLVWLWLWLWLRLLLHAHGACYCWHVYGWFEEEFLWCLFRRLCCEAGWLGVLFWWSFGVVLVSSVFGCWGCLGSMDEVTQVDGCSLVIVIQCLVEATVARGDRYDTPIHSTTFIDCTGNLPDRGQRDIGNVSNRQYCANILP